MTSRLSDISLILSILLWGTLVGAFAYSHVVYFPVYLSSLPESAVIVTGPYGLHDERFWMFFHPVLVLSLIATAALNWRVEARRGLILVAIGIYAVALVATGSYFVPELIAFANSGKSNVLASEWLARGLRWQRLSWTRGAFMSVAEVPLLLALMRPNTANSDQARP